MVDLNEDRALSRFIYVDNIRDASFKIARARAKMYNKGLKYDTITHMLYKIDRFLWSPTLPLEKAMYTLEMFRAWTSIKQARSYGYKYRNELSRHAHEAIFVTLSDMGNRYTLTLSDRKWSNLIVD